MLHIAFLLERTSLIQHTIYVHDHFIFYTNLNHVYIRCPLDNVKMEIVTDKDVYIPTDRQNYMIPKTLGFSSCCEVLYLYKIRTLYNKFIWVTTKVFTDKFERKIRQPDGRTNNMITIEFPAYSCRALINVSFRKYYLCWDFFAVLESISFMWQRTIELWGFLACHRWVYMYCDTGIRVFFFKSCYFRGPLTFTCTFGSVHVTVFTTWFKNLKSQPGNNRNPPAYLNIFLN